MLGHTAGYRESPHLELNDPPRRFGEFYAESRREADRDQPTNVNHSSVAFSATIRPTVSHAAALVAERLRCPPINAGSELIRTSGTNANGMHIVGSRIRCQFLNFMSVACQRRVGFSNSCQ